MDDFEITNYELRFERGTMKGRLGDLATGQLCVFASLREGEWVNG